MKKYRSRKTGNVYLLLGYALDITQGRERTINAVFRGEHSLTLYSMDKKEFHERFEALEGEA